MSPRTVRACQSAAAVHGPPVDVTVPSVCICMVFLPEPRSCSLARNAVLDFCRAQGLTHLTDDAGLLTSELVGNAVEHAGTPITLTAESRGGELNVWVTDDNAALAIDRKTEPDRLGERGRGLLVVDTIAADWGTTQQGTSKSVWFRLS